MPRQLLAFALACLALVGAPLLAAESKYQPTFGPSPRLATTVERLAELKTSAEHEPRRLAAIKAADKLLANPPQVPRGAGDWIFYYACADDGADLRPESLTSHRCPKCMKVYTDERTCAAYRTRLHDQAGRDAETLAWGYAYTDDDRYAAAVREILVQYADDYASYPKRRDRWGRTGIFAQLGGRRYAQSLDEAVGILKLTAAYDLSRASKAYSDADRQHIERDFFRPTADTLLWSNLDINNHQTWYNAGLMAIASVLGDGELVQKVLTMRGGYLDQLERSMGRDGLWYEGSLAYHNYALQAMISIVETGGRLGMPLQDEPKFKAMITAPLLCAYPNGQFPAINDSDYANINSFRSHFLWAWQTYREPRFAHAYAGTNAKQLAELLGPDAQPQPAIDTESRNLADAGLAILRQGSGPTAACVMLDYGPHGGGHGHYDKLNIVLYAGGREWLLDPGRLTYSHKEYKTWVKHTAAHNTVAVAGKSQFPGTGRLLWLQQEKVFSACACETDKAYFGTKLSRRLLLTENMLVDLFDVAGQAPQQVDLFAHAVAKSVGSVTDRGTGKGASLGDAQGYQHLTDGREWPVTGESAWDFTADPQHRLRTWLLSPPGEQVFTCTGIGYWINTPAPALVRRRNAAVTRFVTVYDLTPNGGYVTGLKGTPDKPGPLTINTVVGVWHINLDSPRATATLIPPGY